VGKLDGRVAIVSGSGRGIGKAIALKFAQEGARVVINDLDPEACASAVAEVIAAGGEAVGCPGSVTDPAFPDRFVKTALDRFGDLDIVVNNAGYTWDNVIQKMTDEQFDAILDVHLRAPFRILRAAGNHFRSAAKAEAEAGTPVHRKVVNISSVSGTVGNAGQANYSSAKAGIIGLTRALAKEWGRYRVNVNAVAFGLIETRLTTAPAHGGATIDIEGRKIPVGINPDAFTRVAQLIPLGRAGTPDDAAGAVFLLCIPESDYVTGECLTCGGGYKMS
jgi:3-oxoacyl-[acyl-carrier protein] reductase